MCAKRIKLKEADEIAQDSFIYPKTSAWLVEGLGDYISKILNPVKRTAIKDFLRTSVTENRLSVYVDETDGRRKITFTFPPFSEPALEAFKQYGNSNLRLVLFRHNMRMRGHTYTSSFKYLRMDIAYMPQTWVSPENTGNFSSGRATLFGPDSFSPKVTLDELRTGVIIRDLALNASGNMNTYSVEYAYNEGPGDGSNFGQSPASISNRRINKSLIDGGGFPPMSQYQWDNVPFGLPLYQREGGYNVLNYPDGWRTGYRIGFIYLDDAAANELYQPDFICTVPFSLETINDSLRRSDFAN